MPAWADEDDPFDFSVSMKTFEPRKEPRKFNRTPASAPLAPAKKANISTEPPDSKEPPASREPPPSTKKAPPTAQKSAKPAATASTAKRGPIKGFQSRIDAVPSRLPRMEQINNYFKDVDDFEFETAIRRPSTPTATAEPAVSPAPPPPLSTAPTAHPEDSPVPPPPTHMPTHTAGASAASGEGSVGMTYPQG